MPSRVQIFYHGNCFDGVVSAAVLSRFFLDGPYPGAEISYRGMGHSPNDPYHDHDKTFAAEVNAVVDFRYSPSPRLAWWCDHHQTTFLAPEDRAHFDADRSGRKCFDPTAPSCAGLLGRWLAQQHGFDDRPFANHIRWADLIDSASYESPSQAVELREPALRLMMLLEQAPPAELVDWLIRALSAADIDTVCGDARISSAVGPLLEAHQRSIELFRSRLRVDNGVAFADFSGDDLEGFNKFIPYYLEEGIAYTVVVTHSSRRAKVSVGSNPWSRPSPLHNLGELCQRYGGGGHPVVGAVTLPASEKEAARRIGAEIASILRSG
jgi:hypothetical protein